LHDNSDWWSILGQDDSDSEAHIPMQERELAPSNFSILGISLRSRSVLDDAAAKIGKVQVVNRGDASSGRSQACYVSSPENDEKAEKLHLIFERGEIDDTFYLFAGGPDWYGSDRCLPSPLISRRLSSAAGLRLRQTPTQVIAILGKPTVRRAKELIYFVHARNRTSPADLEKMRQANPGLNDEDFHKNWDFYDLTTYIDAKFTNSKLTFLSVSMSETY
jgi:hypothetical protein